GAGRACLRTAADAPPRSSSIPTVPPPVAPVVTLCFREALVASAAAVSRPNGPAAPNQEADDLKQVTSRVLLRAVIAVLALAGVVFAVPAHANTKDDLDAAREELQSKQAELDALTLQWQ